MADGLTKGLGPDRHRRLAKAMGMGVWNDENKEEKDKKDGSDGSAKV